MIQDQNTVTYSVYTSGEYLKSHPLWHVEESPWKAAQILEMLSRNRLEPSTICDVGCGAGEVLRSLQQQLDPRCRLRGYDISPQALAKAQERANDNLEFRLADIREEDCHFDLLLALDVLEHLVDYFGFLAALKPKGKYKIFHFPLDLSVQTVIRPQGLLGVRARYGHLHYFTKELALKALEEGDYQILDHFYTARATGQPSRILTRKLMNAPRRLLFAIRQDFAVRLLGGWSLLVLAK